MTSIYNKRHSTARTLDRKLPKVLALVHSKRVLLLLFDRRVNTFRAKCFLSQASTGVFCGTVCKTEGLGDAGVHRVQLQHVAVSKTDPRVIDDVVKMLLVTGVEETARRCEQWGV